METQFIENLKILISSQELGELTKGCRGIPQKLVLKTDAIVAINGSEEQVTLATRTGAWWSAEAGPTFGVVDRLLYEIRDEMKENNLYFNNQKRDQVLVKALEKTLKLNDYLRSQR